MLRFPRFSLAVLTSLLAVTCAHAFELGAPRQLNPLSSAIGGYGATDPENSGQFTSVGVTSSGVAPGAKAEYIDTQGQMVSASTVQLKRAVLGSPFTAGAPRYYLGDEILPPQTDADNDPVEAGYWRQMPVRPGEFFANPNGAALVDDLGNYLLDDEGSSGTPLPELADGEYEAFYYSPHADRTFASVSGAVEIWWVSAAPQDSNGDGGAYKFRKEVFTVSSATSLPVRKIYWTEQGFDAPRVVIPDGSVQTVNVIYTSQFPETVDVEYKAVGAVEDPDPNANSPDVLRTLWFVKMAGVATLSAYNREGRVLVEYLGEEVSPGKYKFVGADVIEVIRSASPFTNVVELGQELLPRDLSTELIASPLNSVSATSSGELYGTSSDLSGKQHYYAEQENPNPDAVQFYWMELVPPAINFLADEEPLWTYISWPKYRDRYQFVWPDQFDRYAFVTTNPAGSDSSTGLSFHVEIKPSIVFQDDPNRAEVSFDTNSQVLIANLESSDDGLNRTLLKFSGSNSVWYQPLYIQAEDRADYVEPDGAVSLEQNVTVGDRIERPSTAYSVAGAISGGTGYMESAYLNPYELGVEAAEAGAIIPVNALPDDQTLTVRWFEKVEPTEEYSEAFEPFYVPSKVGRYTVTYPQPLGEWVDHAGLEGWRQDAAAVRLNDGRVLLLGGTYGSSEPEALRLAEIYDPASESWTRVDDMHAARGLGLSATLLQDGRVLVVGGQTEVAGVGEGIAELFDPNTGSWTQTSENSDINRYHHRALLLSDGSVLVSGGIQDGASLKRVRVYHPDTDSWTSVGNTTYGRYKHQLSLLSDGTVLITGGTTNTRKSELYDPVTQKCSTTTSIVETRRGHTATSLLDGRILLVGSDSGTGIGSAEVFDPESSSSTFLDGNIPGVASGHAATLLLDGSVLVVGGEDSSGTALSSTAVFDPETNSWSSGPQLPFSASAHSVARLHDGRVLLTGMQNSSDSYLLDVQDYLVMASQQGTEGLTAEQAAGTLYYQNDPAAIGYNPNEEHAVKMDNRYWALRDDLNVTSGEGYSSEPVVLVAYTDPDDGRPAMRTFRVERESEDYQFDYPWTAGTKLQGPMPLPLMALPLRDDVIANAEVSDSSTETTVPAASAPPSYAGFTFEDRQGYQWVYRGPHAEETPSFEMNWYYPMADGFYFPSEATQPEVGTALPYLRAWDGVGSPIGDAVNGDSIAVAYTPSWPDSVPVMRIGETLTLAKYGLPDVRNQKSAEVPYQQSIALEGSAQGSVVLHDPTRYKSIALEDTALLELPTTIRTAEYQGKTYFQGLPPHLQARFYYDPLASAMGSLILTGEFYDEISGEDYVDLNVLSSQDLDALKALAVNEDETNANAWENAIDHLSSRVETFVENEIQQGSFIVSDDSELTYDVAIGELAQMPDADSARDSYALTADGQGAGYVTLMFANGRNPELTPAGDPPVMQIIRVLPELYNGDVKVRLSTNPLDEKVSLRHSSDFAALPEHYEFEWYYAPPTDSGTQPPVYTYTNELYLGDSANPSSEEWLVIQSPVSELPALADYPAELLSLPNSVVVRAAEEAASTELPASVFRSNTAVDFSAGIPDDIVFSAELGALDGFVLYVNGVAAMIYGNGVTALDSLLADSGYELYDLRLMVASSVDDLPLEGEGLLVIAQIDSELHFRVFDAAGQQLMDAHESELGDQTSALNDLRNQLINLWATTNLATSDKLSIVATAAEILGLDLDHTASTSLSDSGLALQFAVPAGYFIQGANTIEVAVYSAADAGVYSTVDFRLEGASRTDAVLGADSSWQVATGTPALDNRAVVGGSPTAPLGSPLLVMSDNYFTMRYRARELLADDETNPAYTLTGGTWSNWTQPVLVEGWIKRVLAAINPFNQRMTDLYNNAVNTDVSLIAQAGTRWEGDISMTLDAIDDYGLIEIYETVLNRGKSISIESGYDYGPANDALLLAAGYLSDLYTIMGNEAYADAANPTISIDDSESATEINTSRFAFEGQVASVLEEELALLRGRDDALSPQVTEAPFYNRLFWNYTRGIDSGEALYATNYNIQEKVGSSTADGIIDAADAQRMFPQGHGDGYGHYLSALKGYYQLLTEPSFTWTPRIESLNIHGTTVAVDYQDERKFAKAAANVARSAEQVVSLTHRQQYTEDAADGWESYRDETFNSDTGTTRHWGLDAWASRAAQGAYYNWVVGNAMLPDVDDVNTGIQKVDRSTVPELELLVVSADSLQNSLDSANAHLNPLGLSVDAIAFDIDPALLSTGESHYEQVYERALAAVLNAKGAFDQAARMTRLLRNQENDVDDFNTTLQDEERMFEYQLIDLYGSPYPGDIGPGKTYSQGYEGPDLVNWFVIDRPSTHFGSHSDSVNVTVRVPVELDAPWMFSDYIDETLPDEYDHDYSFYGVPYASPEDPNDPNDEDYEFTPDVYQYLTGEFNSNFVEKEVTVTPSAYGQFVDEWMPEVDAGQRRTVGRLQESLNQVQIAYMQVLKAAEVVESAQRKMDLEITLVDEILKFNLQSSLDKSNYKQASALAAISVMASKNVLLGLKKLREFYRDSSQTGLVMVPKTNGTSNDVTFSVRGAIKAGFDALDKKASFVELATKVAITTGEWARSKGTSFYESWVAMRATNLSDLQRMYELDLSIEEFKLVHHDFVQKTLKLQQANEQVGTILAEGERIQLEREIFRRRAATVVQGYRTNDLTFRAFRNEALEQYRTLFDLSSRYTYLAAKSYDYETGLLGSSEGQAVFSSIVSSRALGDLTGDMPQATVSTLGDSGLAGTMAQLQADYSVAEGRLGINNPDANGTLISLRQELFRILDDPDSTEDDDAWMQTLEQHIVSDLLLDTDVVAQCRNIANPAGTAVPGIVIPFSSTIEHGKNFFGLPIAGGDHLFSPSNFATKIYSVGAMFDGYVGMDPYSEFIPGAGAPDTNDPNVLSATPYLYLIPVGSDRMLAPALGDTGVVRSWDVQDQALPLPYNLGADAFSSNQFFNANGTLTEQPWILRKHQAFRAVDDPAFFYGGLRNEFGSSRLVGRSVWNTQWKLVIPAYGLLDDEEEGLDRFVETVKDIKLFLRTYSHSGN